MEMQIEILLKVIQFCYRVFIWVIPGMLIVNIFLEMGILKLLIAPVGWFFRRFANLPQEIGAAFISSFGSSYAAGSMLINFRDKGILNDRQVFLSAITFSIPFHIRELFTYYLPVVLPMLGVTLGSIYIVIHTTTIIIKFLFVIFVGKITLPNTLDERENTFEKDTTVKKNMPSVIKDSIKHTIKPLKRMMVTIPLTALVIYELNALGVFQALPINAEKLGLPTCSTACLVAYMSNTIMGLTSLSACFNAGDLTVVQAVKTMLWGSLLAAPIFLIRFSGAYYVGVYGPRIGMRLALTTFTINSFVYLIFLVVVAQSG